MHRISPPKLAPPMRSVCASAPPGLPPTGSHSPFLSPSEGSSEVAFAPVSRLPSRQRPLASGREEALYDEVDSVPSKPRVPKLPGVSPRQSHTSGASPCHRERASLCRRHRTSSSCV